MDARDRNSGLALSSSKFVLAIAQSGSMYRVLANCEDILKRLVLGDRPNDGETEVHCEDDLKKTRARDRPEDDNDDDKTKVNCEDDLRRRVLRIGLRMMP